ncbi:DUF3945 domain-containing protein [Hymenobacter sp. UV11]|uniref:DUF3945 domain-containing protein n=1 Tax=Hymenobacter sp. UV11 TaxID=1849735 RepID=UPI00105ED002|nr:DUF3945 domain-containing protein [Hymenobacter sp. UV11]TDN39873.1 hypothetical protein A8B98_16920 [Hymenobacter sp. UV11]TFZ63203.1 DUF3945 domain-containing protein [Hymenobacter sp. UV11]
MAEQAEVPAPTPDLFYMSSLPTPNGNIASQGLTTEQGNTSLFQVQVNPNNPDQAALVPAPGADGRLLNSLADSALRVFDASRLPGANDKYLTVEQPTMLEKIGDNWKVVSQGKIGFSPNAPEPVQVFGNKPEVAPEAPAQVQQPTQRNTADSVFLNGLPMPDGTMGRDLLANRQAHYSLYELRIDPTNPNRAEAYPAPGADGQILYSQHTILKPLFDFQGQPQPGQEYLDVKQPAIFERSGDTWKMTERGNTGFSDQPEQRQQAQLTTRAAELASEVATTTGPTRVAVEAELEGVANRAERGPDAGKAAYADGLRDEAAAKLGTDQRPAPTVAAAPAAAEKPAQEQAPAPAQESSAGELQIRWKQQGNEVAPLLEMRAYIDQLKDSGVAVGPMKFEKGADGKLSGSFGMSYDPASPELTKLEGTIQGLKRVGNGVEVVEKPEQVVARRQSMGVESQDQATDLGYSVKEAFGVKQWDALSAQLSQAPKQALTGPEQAQQAAGVERVQQVAKQQGKTTEQVIQDGKSLLDIDTSGNPVSAFLKNFYEHLNGAPKTRQTLEVDYDKTRQDLQARLVKLAGNADAGDQLKQGTRPEGVTPTAATAAGVTAATVAAGAPAPAAAVAPAPQPAAPAQAPKFTEADIPQKVLATMGLTVADLSANGQLQKLLNGQKTDLVAMQAGGKDGQEPVKFEAKMVLHREADGSATLKMELPKKQLVIPNEIGGQPFTPEQRKQLESEGTAGLVRGLKDKEGNTYNGYVGVDKEMNKLVVLPENKVTFKDEIAGVKLSPEQSHDLREGKAVHLAQMNRPDGGKPFDGTVQIHAAKAGVEVKPEPYELGKKQAPAATQTRDLDSDKKQAPIVAPAVKVSEEAAPKPRVRGPRI